MSFPSTVYLDTNATITTSATQKFALGTRGLTPDGRVFHYARAGEAISVGRLVMAKTQMEWGIASTNAALSTDGALAQTAGLTSTWDRIVLSSTWSAFSPPSSTGVTADLFKDGMAWVAKGTGYGQAVRIKSNTTGSTGVAGQSVTIVFKDNDRFSASLTTANEFAITTSQYDRVTMDIGATFAIGGTATNCVGVAPVAVASGYYFWAQTWGMCPVLAVGTLVLGQEVVQSTDANTTGGVSAGVTSSTGLEMYSALRRPAIGDVIVVGTDAEFALINLKIAP